MEKMTLILKDAISKVMEEMFFLVTDENISSSSICKLWYIELQKGANIFCRMDFVLDDTLVLVMSENFLSKSADEISEEEKASVTKEFINMVVGSMLEKMDKHDEIKMGFPKKGNLIQTDEIPDIEMTFESGKLRVYLDYE